jgi:ATP-dependent DNA helicase RecG
MSSGAPDTRVLHLEWDSLPAPLQAELRTLAEPVSKRGKVSAPLLRDTILALCAGRYLGLRVLAQALERDSDDLRKRALMPMLKEGSLQAAFSAANSPKQAYTSAGGAIAVAVD